MIRSLSLLLGLCFLAAGAVSTMAQPSQTDVAVQEAVRREANIISLRQKLEAAQSAEWRGDLVAAAKLYEDALKLVEAIGPNNIEKESGDALRGLTDVRMSLAIAAQKRGDMREADIQVTRVLKVNPQHKEALEFKKNNDQKLAELQGMIPSKEYADLIPQLTTNHINNLSKIQNAKLLYEFGKLDEAEVVLKQVLKDEPNNYAAQYYMSLVREHRYAGEVVSRELETKRNILEVEKAWSMPNDRDSLPVPNPFAQTNLIYTSKERQQLAVKLKQIKLDNIGYNAVPLSDVIRSLASEVKRRDPDKMGINFIIAPRADGVNINGGVIKTEVTNELTGIVETSEEIQEPIDLSKIIININPPISDIKLQDLLEVILKVSDQPIKYSVEDYGILISLKKREAGDPLFVRYYKIDPNTFWTGLAGVGDSGIGSGVSGGGGNYGYNGGGNYNNNYDDRYNNNNGNRYNNRYNNNNDNRYNNNYDSRYDNRYNNNNYDNRYNNNNYDNRYNNNNYDDRYNNNNGNRYNNRYNNNYDDRYNNNNYDNRYNDRYNNGGNYNDSPISVPRVRTTGGSSGGVAGMSGITSVQNMAAIQNAVRGFFGAVGVDLSFPKTVFFNDRQGVLVVRATLRDLDIIEEAVRVMNIVPPLVNIRARFAEFNQDDGHALGFDWYLGNTLMGDKVGMMGGTAPSFNGAPSTANPNGFFPGTSAATTILPAVTDGVLTSGLRQSAPALATVTGILTDPQFRVVIRAIEQRQGAEVLSAPEVTTVSGRQAQLQMLDVQTIVTRNSVSQNYGGPAYSGYDQYNGGQNYYGGGNISSVSQYDTQSIPTGPSLDVVPYVSADGYTVQMICIPTISEFVGYDDPGKFQQQAQSVAGQGGAVQPITSVLPLPRFRVRQVTTTSIVWDGQTIAMGGLISENVTKTKDKVPVLGDLPVLGRLFRSESNLSQKKNLVIFVTPTILDPAGNRVHTDADLPFHQKSLPTQRPVVLEGAAGAK